MRGCGCANCGKGLGAAPITISQGSPCANQYLKAFGYGTGTHSLIDELAYYLCEGENKLTSWGVGLWHWTWTELERLWTWLENVTKQAVTALQQAVADFMACLDCLDPTAPASAKQKCTTCPKIGTPAWMRDLGLLALLAGGAFLLHEFSPAINDAAHYHYRRA